MKSTLINKIFLIVGFIGSVLTIIDFISDHLKITIPKIIFFPEFIKGFEYLYANCRVYIFILSLFIFLISLFSVYKTKKYNAKVTEDYDHIIYYFSSVILREGELDYEYLSSLIKYLYPYKNKSRINLAIFYISKEEQEYKTIYDTLDFKEWKKKKITNLRKRLGLKRYWWVEKKYIEKQYLCVGNSGTNSSVLLYIYGNSKAAFTKRKKQMIEPLLRSIIIFICIVLEQQNN